MLKNSAIFCAKGLKQIREIIEKSFFWNKSLLMMHNEIYEKRVYWENM